MKKVLLSVAAVLALSAAPAFAADMPVKAVKAPVAAPSPWDVAFGTAFTTDYELRGISQSGHLPSANGYFELDYTATDWLKLYAGIHGYSLWTGFASAEFDESAGARFSVGNFGLDVGYVYYYYPGPNNGTGANISFGEFYAMPSYKFTDWLTVGAVVDGGDDCNNVSGKSCYYYSGNATITLPWQIANAITTSINGEVGRQHFDSFFLLTDYTYWDVGIDFNYKAVTLDLRYWDTNVSAPTAAECIGTRSNGSLTDLCSSKFVATLKFDTTLSALK